jgi:hypothetical protein
MDVFRLVQTIVVYRYNIKKGIFCKEGKLNVFDTLIWTVGDLGVLSDGAEGGIGYKE